MRVPDSKSLHGPRTGEARGTKGEDRPDVSRLLGFRFRLSVVRLLVPDERIDQRDRRAD